LPVDLFKRFVERLSDYQLGADRLVEAFGSFESGATADGLVTVERAGSALVRAIELTGDAEFSLRLGQDVKLTQFGALGFAVMSCETLRDALGLLIRYHPLMGMGLQWRLTKGERTTRLAPVLAGLQTDVLQAFMEANLSALAAAGRELLGRPLTSIVFHLSYPAPDHAQSYQKYIHAPTEFEQPDCEIALPNWLLDQSIRTGNPAGHAVFRAQCEEMLRTLSAREGVSASVRRIILQGGRSALDIEWVARELAYSERTLRRRLDDEGTSFRSICDEVRNLLSQNYLSSTQLTVSEIAELLDYAEPASFRRAFKRWNGVTPQTFRQGDEALD